MTHIIRADREAEHILLPYEVCIKLPEHKDHNIVTSSLETLAHLLRNAKPLVVYSEIEAYQSLASIPKLGDAMDNSRVLTHQQQGGGQRGRGPQGADHPCSFCQERRET